MKCNNCFCLLLVSTSLLFASCNNDSNEPDNEPKYFDFSISPSGGTYVIGENFVMTVPPGAVSSTQTVSVKKLTNELMKTIFVDYGATDFPVIAGFDIKPAGLKFAQPITFTYKSLSYATAYVPLTHTVDLTNNTHSIDSCMTIVDNVNDSLCVSVVRSGSYIVEALSDWLEGISNLKSIAGCKEGIIKVESQDKDVQCSFENCQTIESKVKVQFLTCNGAPIESCIVRENAGDCAAAMTLTPEASVISLNSSTSIDAQVKVGCTVVEAQTVTMTVSGPATLSPGSFQTDAEGNGKATLTSGNSTGTAVITANVTLKYPVREIIINGNVEEALYRTEIIDAQTSVEIKDLTTWHIELDISVNTDGIDHEFGCAYSYRFHIAFDYSNTYNSMDDSVFFNVEAEVDQSLSGLYVPQTSFTYARGGDCSITIQNMEVSSNALANIYGYYIKEGNKMRINLIEDSKESYFCRWKVHIEGGRTGVICEPTDFPYEIGSFQNCGENIYDWIIVSLEDGMVYNGITCMPLGVYYDSGAYELKVTKIN
jgi:hypothetical protein